MDCRRASLIKLARSSIGSLALLLPAASVGCGGAAASYVHSDTTTLGRVVVYRNGVAYFERYAHVDGNKLGLAVPADKVDDFLKSLNVADAHSGELAPIAYPTSAQAAGTGLVDMQVQLPGHTPHDLRLSYVTEAPAWKPSYRVSVGADKKVDLVGWAIVDNTSGEDWKNVRLGVGASSAMSFRFDLRSVRTVERETLQSNDLFAQAPPTGQSIYGGPADLPKQVIGEVAEDAVALDEGDTESAPVAAAPMPMAQAASGAPATRASGGAVAHKRAAPARPAPQAEEAVRSLAQRLRASHGTVVVEGFAAANDDDKQTASQRRADRLRDRLVREGIDPARVVAVGKGEATGRAGGARIVESAAPPAPPGSEPKPAGSEGPLDPIGTSHFESAAPMTVPRGTSAMVSILHTSTDGEVVYLYDPESARGNAQFAFKALRLKNPTDSQLESGPITVFGDGRFVGEGMSEPIPARQIAFVPFALDRQVVVDRTDDQRDEIARILTVQRGVFSTETRHIKKTTLVLRNRMATPAVVYVRHSVATGYRSIKAPGDAEHVGGAELYRFEVEGLGKREVTLEEATPVYRTADIRTPDGTNLVRAYLTSAAIDGALRRQVEDLLKTQKEIADGEERIATLREQMAEFRQRMDELHAQIVTLRAVRTAGPLMVNLEKKLQEISDRMSKSTIDVVSLEEKLMLSRIRFQDGVADLSLEATTAPVATAAAPQP